MNNELIMVKILRGDFKNHKPETDTVHIYPLPEYGTLEELASRIRNLESFHLYISNKLEETKQ